MTGFGSGVGYLGRGFAMWRRRPGLMLLGVLPALLVFVVLAAAYVVLAIEVGDVVSWATPFADGWVGGLRVLVRVLLAVALLVGALLVASSLFVALTLIVGDPFYERIWRATEAECGGPVPDHDPGLAAAVRDGVRLGAVGLLTGVVVFALGFLPVVGSVVGVLLGVTTSGYLLARELLDRPWVASGLDGAQRADLRTRHRSTVLGFGTVTQLFFLVPLGAVVVMPAAVVGSTLLARDLLESSEPAQPSQPEGRPDSV